MVVPKAMPIDVAIPAIREWEVEDDTVANKFGPGTITMMAQLTIIKMKLEKYIVITTLPNQLSQYSR
jgi:hypothetical protein